MRVLQRASARWVVGGVIVLLAVLVGGSFVFFHFIEGKAPAPLALSTASTTTAAPGVIPATNADNSSTAVGTWKIAKGSVVGDRVKETLFGQSHIGTAPADGTTIKVAAAGKLTLHGTTNAVRFQVEARKTGASIQVSGSMPITFSDYNIDNPSGGPASVGNAGTLEFLLDLSKA